MKSSYELLSDLTASAVNIRDCFHHGDAEFLEFGVFLRKNSLLRGLSASAVQSTTDSFEGLCRGRRE